MKIKMKRVLFRIGLILLVIVVVILGLRAVLNYTTGRKLQAYLEKAKAEGMIMTMNELQPQCNDADNAALLWKAAEALIVLPEKEDRVLVNKTIEDFFYDRPLQEEVQKKLAQFFEKNHRVFELVLEASGRPCFRSGDWTKLLYDMEPTNAVKMIIATKLLGTDAVFRAEGGQIPGALEELRQGMRFVWKTIDEPFLIRNLVALANQKALVVCFNRIVINRDVDSASLAAWIKEMDPESWRTKFWRCIQTERVRALETGLNVIKGDTGTLRALESKGNMFFYWLTRPLQKLEIIWIQNQYRDLEKNANLPYYEIKELFEKSGWTGESIPWYSRISGLLLADFQSVFLKEATLEAMMLTAKAGLACKIYKSQNGRYPEKLAALVPDLIDKVPIDPFTGKPLIYRAEDAGVIIYSLGSNQKDDGGQGTYLITQLVMENDDDWAWKEGKAGPAKGRQ